MGMQDQANFYFGYTGVKKNCSHVTFMHKNKILIWSERRT